MADVIELLRESLAPRYEVERQIGAGGMARVYLATEQHPRRPVAIKVLEPDLSTRLLYDRFIREVELSSRLSHPHVVPIFAAGQAGDLLYYVMPYIEGESLRHSLLKRGRLPLDEAVHIVLDVADALAYAHGQGVVHRDIKPENILLSGGHPVVADFGVARAISAAGGQSLTQTGHAVGSPGYMSPEQAMGGQVDARTDIFSLGCLLFELLSGELPTRAGVGRVSNWETLSKSGALRGVSTGETRAVKHAISRALAPLPEDRFATVTEFADALGGSAHRPSLPKRGRFASRRSWRTAVLGAGLVVVAGGLAVILARRGSALTPGRVVVAVIENHTGDAQLDPLGHMAADWVTQGLAQTGLVEVVSSMSAMASSAPAVGLDVAGIRALGRETGARTVVSGGYYRQGDSLRFQIQITDAHDGKVLRALDPVVGSVANQLASVEVVRQRVMAALATLFNPQLAKWVSGASQPTTFEAYLEFADGLDRFGRTDMPGAAEHFARAAQRDSTFSVALIWSAMARLSLGQFATAEAIARRVEQPGRRLAPFDRAYLSYVESTVRSDPDGALEAAREMTRVAPGSEALYLVGIAATRLNRPREAVAAYEDLGPDRGLFRAWFWYWCDYTTALHQLGDHEREWVQAEEGRRRFPDHVGMLACDLRALAALGRVDEVRERFGESIGLPLDPQWTPPEVAVQTAQELRAHGHEDTGRELLTRGIAWYQSRPRAEQQSELLRRSLGVSYYELGRLDDARDVFLGLAAVRAGSPDPDRLTWTAGYLGAIAARQGNRQEALRLDRTLQAMRQPYLFGRHTMWRARIHALLGDRDQAVELIRTALAQGDFEMAYLHTELAFEGLRDFPPFVELLKPKG